ncbi:hypothetical protein LEP1GSC074_0098 [Leptospira noguchii str. Hook]|nr:hypothetical protein LEP1GSC074_0098 [Leptospira noguchii str. Hook]
MVSIHFLHKQRKKSFWDKFLNFGEKVSIHFLHKQRKKFPNYVQSIGY